MQRILKPRDKCVILVDDREKASSIPNILKRMGLIVKFLRLDVGDYLISERVVVERKTRDDFVSSVINNRIFEQAENMRKNFEKPILLIEGTHFRENMNENAIKAAISSLLLGYGTSVVMCDNELESAKTIYWLVKKEQEGNKTELSIKGKKKPKDIRKLQEHILSGLPGISTTLSKKLLEKFKTVRGIANAKENEIANIKGIGKKQAKYLHLILNKEYEVDE